MLKEGSLLKGLFYNSLVKEWVVFYSKDVHVFCALHSDIIHVMWRQH